MMIHISETDAAKLVSVRTGELKPAAVCETPFQSEVFVYLHFWDLVHIVWKERQQQGCVCNLEPVLPGYVFQSWDRLAAYMHVTGFM